MEYEINDATITLKQTFDAPKDVVFSMFQNPHIAKWWGPSTYPVTVSRQDFSVGGTWHYCMTGPEGEQAWGKAIYDEIDQPNKITYRDYFSDADGTIDESLPAGTITILFNEVDGKTTVTSIGTYESADAITKLVEMGMIDGVTETWVQLDKLLNKMQSQSQ